MLEKFGSKVWIKWPNDFYIENSKLGGAITSLTKDFIYCGIGINMLETSLEYGFLDIKIDQDLLLKNYFEELEKAISWKQIYTI